MKLESISDDGSGLIVPTRIYTVGRVELAKHQGEYAS